MNLMVIDGNLTKDMEIRFTSGKGVAIGNFTIANNEYAGKGNERRTTFIDCVIFGEIATKIVDYMTKGKKVLVSGAFQKKRNEKDGKVYINTYMKVNNIEFLSKKESQGNSNIDGATTVADGDVPF